MHSPRHLSISALLGTLLVAMSAPAIAQNTAPPPELHPPGHASPQLQEQKPQQSTPTDQGSSGASAASTDQRSSGAPSAPAAMSTTGITVTTVPMVVLVPVEAQAETGLNNGCWVRLQDKDAMVRGNEVLTIVGRMYMPSFETPSGVNWSRKADSLTVGPNAKVTVFGERNYEGKMAALEPGQQIRDLNGDLGMSKSIDSLRVDCVA